MRFVIALAFLIASQSLIPAALACSCAPPPPPKQALAGSTAVFSGKCISVEIKEQRKIVTFEVDRVWKGEVGKTVTITTAAHGATCGYAFTTKGDATYLVYCYGKPDALSTNICTRTRSLAAGADDIKELGDGEKPRDERKKE